MVFRNIILAAVFFVTSVVTSKAQYDRVPGPVQESIWDKIYFGGYFALQFGSYTVVDIAPQIGYRLTERLTTGIGLNYLYYKYSDPVYNYSYSTNAYGGSLFARCLVFENIFAYAEFSQLNLEVADYFHPEGTRQWIPAFFVGGGYRQSLGERSAIQFLLLYDVIQDRYSPYDNPVIRIGFGFGF